MRTRQQRRYFIHASLLLLFVVGIWRLGLSYEAIFFLTWLFLVLTVRHDCRLSIVMGLILLACCPFLLIVNKEPVAEQAANYSYFFLAIGVLAQLQEMLFEKYGRDSLKLDLSPLWRPLTASLEDQWGELAESIAHELRHESKRDLVRKVQIWGTLGLAVVFLATAFLGSIGIALPLLAAAFLFPFVIWGLGLVGRIWGTRRLLTILSASILLPIISLTLVATYKLTQEAKLATMPVYYDFIDHLACARNAEDPLLVAVRFWTIEDEIQRVLYAHPSANTTTALEYDLYLPQESVLSFSIAMAPESWSLEGDGVSFQVYIQDETGLHQIFSRYIDPKHNQADRSWHPHNLPLDEYANKEVRFLFITDAGPSADFRYDWAGWGDPRLLSHAATPTPIPTPLATPLVDCNDQSQVSQADRRAPCISLFARRAWRVMLSVHVERS